MRYMKYECSTCPTCRERCYMFSHVPLLGVFDIAFNAAGAPSRFGFTDSDGKVERNGCLLELELKGPKAPLPKGQRICYENMCRSVGQRYYAYVVWSPNDFSEIQQVQRFWRGKDFGPSPMTLKTLRHHFTYWYFWANKQTLDKLEHETA